MRDLPVVGRRWLADAVRGLGRRPPDAGSGHRSLRGPRGRLPVQQDQCGRPRAEPRQPLRGPRWWWIPLWVTRPHPRPHRSDQPHAVHPEPVQDERGAGGGERIAGIRPRGCPAGAVDFGSQADWSSSSGAAARARCEPAAHSFKMGPRRALMPPACVPHGSQSPRDEISRTARRATCPQRQTSPATLTISRSLANSSAGVSALPPATEANPHCGDRAS